MRIEARRAARPRVRSRRRASSSSVFRLASGVRSSWLASATNPRSRSSAASSRASIALSVSPSRRISSSAGGSGSCSPGRSSLTSAAFLRIASTGRSAAAATAYPASEARISAIGRPTPSSSRSVASDSSLSSVAWPTTSVKLVHRHGEEPRGISLLDGVLALDCQRPLARRGSISSGLSSARVRQAAAVDDPALGIEDLGEAVLALDEPVARRPGSAGRTARSRAAMSVARERSAWSVLSFRLSSKRV